MCLNKLADRYINDRVLLWQRFSAIDSEILIKSALTAALCIAKGGKIFSFGEGESGTVAEAFSIALLHRLNKDRPSLPVICLNASLNMAMAIGKSHGQDKILERQLNALGSKDDMLVIFCTQKTGAWLYDALDAAKFKEMSCIIFGTKNNYELQELCNIFIEMPETCHAFANELHFACAHIFCELIEACLFEYAGELLPFLKLS